MNDSIRPLASISPIESLDFQDRVKGQAGNAGQNFTGYLNQALSNLESAQAAGEQAAVSLVTGKTDDFHTPVIAMEKASLALGLAVTVRNKVLDAYHEVMRMQI